MYKYRMVSSNKCTGQSCSICLKDYPKQNNERFLKQLCCLHVFHNGCIDQWLANTPTCPNCRFDINSVYQDEPLFERRLRLARDRLDMKTRSLKRPRDQTNL